MTLRHNWRNFLQQSCQCFQHFPDKSGSASRMSIMYDDGIVGGTCNSRRKLEVNSVTETDGKKKKANFKEQCSNQISLQTVIQLVPGQTEEFINVINSYPLLQTIIKERLAELHPSLPMANEKNDQILTSYKLKRSTPNLIVIRCDPILPIL